MLLLSIVGFSQGTLDKSHPPKFSSVYTRMGKDCWAPEQEAEGIECKFVGGYHVIAGYGAVTENVLIESRDGKISIQLSPSKGENSLTQSGGIVEWRLANGKPFAVIARFTYYDMAKVVEATTASEGKSPFQQRFVTGESLIIKGLKGYEQIDFELDAKTPDTNEKAREMADNAFMQRR